MKQIKAVLFDMDGVLIDEQIHVECWKLIAQKYHLIYNEEKALSQRGVSNETSMEIMIEGSSHHFTDEEKIQIRKDKNKLYEERIQNLTKKDLLPFVESTLATLKTKGYKLAIVSSSKYVHQILNNTDILDYFDVLITGKDIQNFKPNPEIYLKACKDLNLSKEECLIVEDSSPSINNAKDIGFVCAGTSIAYDNKKADYHLRQISDLLKYL